MSTLIIYMKSGNRIAIPFVKDWEMKVKGNVVTSLAIARHWLANVLPSEKLVVTSIDLSQIEALTTK